MSVLCGHCVFCVSLLSEVSLASPIVPCGLLCVSTECSVLTRLPTEGDSGDEAVLSPRSAKAGGKTARHTEREAQKVRLARR